MVKSLKELHTVLAYRHRNPRSRIVDIFRYCKNTSASKQMECVLCKAKGPSWATTYPKTVRADAWEEEHQKIHFS